MWLHIANDCTHVHTELSKLLMAINRVNDQTHSWKLSSWVKHKWRHDHLRHLCLHWVPGHQVPLKEDKMWNFEKRWVKSCWVKCSDIIHPLWLVPCPTVLQECCYCWGYSEKNITDSSLHVRHQVCYADCWHTAGVWLTLKFDPQTSSETPGNSRRSLIHSISHPVKHIHTSWWLAAWWYWITWIEWSYTVNFVGKF